MEQTDYIVNFIKDTSYEKLPKSAIDTAKMAIIDSLGCALAGSKEPMRIPLIKYVEEEGGKPQATILGVGLKSSCTNVALVNGTFNHCLDFDDTTMPALAHPTTTILPSILAICESSNLSGKDAILAYVVGNEVFNKVAGVINPSHWYSGYHSTGTVGCYGSVAAAGKLLNLDARQMKYALGIAASSAAGLKVNLGSMTKPYHAGNAAAIGTRAAILAKHGFTSNQNAFEGRMGFCDVMSKEKRFNFIYELGKVWEIIERPPLIKPHPSCGGTHAAMHALLTLRRKYNIMPDEVEKIEMGTNPGSLEQLIYPDPKDAYEARFSATFTLATAMIHGRWGITVHTDEILYRSDVQDMMKRVHLYVDEQITKEVPLEFVDKTSLVRIFMKDGRVFEQKCDYPVLSLDEVIQKFKECAALVLPDEKINNAIRQLENLEELDNINTLIENLV